MDKTLAWLWLADAVGSACQYAQELLALYPDPAELYDLLRAGTEAPPTCLTPRALAQLQDTTPFDFEERLDHCLLSGSELLTPDEDTYPAANAKLRTAIEKGGGAVCSEYPPGYTGRTTGTFLARNRLIAAQSEALCVAEARTRSGTLNTVHHAERLGRPVLAVPGSIYSALSEGTNELLRTHRAEPLCRAADVLEILGIGAQTIAPEQQRFDPAAVSPDAQQVYAALKPTPQGIDALCAATRLPAGRVLAACTELELMGGAQAQPGRRYIAL